MSTDGKEESSFPERDLSTDADHIFWEYIIIDGIRKLVMSELWATTGPGAKRRLNFLLDKNAQ